MLIKGLTNDPHLPALVVNGGNLLFATDRLADTDAEPAKAAAEGILLATRKMGGTFAAVGTRDLAAGTAFLRQSQPPGFTWLSLNLIDPATEAPLFAPLLMQQLGSVRLAILALTDHNAAAPSESFQVRDWRTSLPAVLARVAKEADIILLLSNYSYVENSEIARTHGTIDLILQTGHAIGNMSPTPVNNSLIAQTEIRGKYLGALDIDWHGHGRWHDTVPAPAAGSKQGPASTYVNRFVILKQNLSVDPEIEPLVQQTQRRVEQLRQPRPQR